jgi:hypothetical protein
MKLSCNRKSDKGISDKFSVKVTTLDLAPYDKGFVLFSSSIPSYDGSFSLVFLASFFIWFACFYISSC